MQVRVVDAGHSTVCYQIKASAEEKRQPNGAYGELDGSLRFPSGRALCVTNDRDTAFDVARVVISA